MFGKPATPNNLREYTKRRFGQGLSPDMQRNLNLFAKLYGEELVAMGKHFSQSEVGSLRQRAHVFTNLGEYLLLFRTDEE
tara:strand:- start:1856 stop:2095 length:240 start_codon:yes stop_codon:yes gene_type:complete